MEIFTRRILITTNLLVRYTMGPLPLLVLLNQRNYAGGNEIEYQKLLFPNLWYHVNSGIPVKYGVID